MLGDYFPHDSGTSESRPHLRSSMSGPPPVNKACKPDEKSKVNVRKLRDGSCVLDRCSGLRAQGRMCLIDIRALIAIVAQHRCFRLCIDHVYKQAVPCRYLNNASDVPVRLHIVALPACDVSRMKPIWHLRTDPSHTQHIPTQFAVLTCFAQ